jgi:hypothetical protein
MFQAVAPLLLLVASTAEPATAAVEPPRVRLELAAGALWQREYDDDYGDLERSGPGVNARATFRLGRRLALATDVAWMRGEDPWPDYSEKTTTVTLTGSVLWHFGSKPVQPYLGVGVALYRRESCFDRPSDPYPSQCSTDNGTSPVVLQAGVKFINFRSGLTIAPEIRVEFLVLRVGLSVGWARLK